MAVIDVFTYNGEKSVLGIRLNILSPYVDRFIICEAKRTFTGKKKPLYFFRHEEKFAKWWPKIDYYIIGDEFTPDEVALAYNSPNTVGAEHWKREFMQKEALKRAMRQYRVQDEDIVYVGDVDEIWQPYVGKMPAKLKLKVYAYYLNNRSNEEFWGTLVAKYKDIKDNCLNHMRSDVSLRTADYWGWHFTSMGGVQEVRRKLGASYTKESYNTTQVQELLEQRVKSGIDYLGRPFSFKLDTSEWPTFLKRSEYRYRHLLRTTDGSNSTITGALPSMPSPST